MWLRKELASRSKFGQDLAAPAACQHHLSLQPVPSSARPCYIAPGEGCEPGPPAASPAWGGGKPPCKRGAPPCSLRGSHPTRRGKSRLPSTRRAAQGAGAGTAGIRAEKAHGWDG